VGSNPGNWTQYNSFNNISICNSGFLDIVHRLYLDKITTFRKLDLLPSSGKKGRTETLAVGPPGLASLRPGLDISIIRSPTSKILVFQDNFKSTNFFTKRKKLAS
jgi:hypothetical protein